MKFILASTLAALVAGKCPVMDVNFFSDSACTIDFSDAENNVTSADVEEYERQLEEEINEMLAAHEECTKIVESDGYGIIKCDGNEVTG